MDTRHILPVLSRSSLSSWPMRHPTLSTSLSHTLPVCTTYELSQLTRASTDFGKTTTIAVDQYAPAIVTASNSFTFCASPGQNGPTGDTAKPHAIRTPTQLAGTVSQSAIHLRKSASFSGRLISFPRLTHWPVGSQSVCSLPLLCVARQVDLGPLPTYKKKPSGHDPRFFFSHSDCHHSQTFRRTPRSFCSQS